MRTQTYLKPSRLDWFWAETELLPLITPEALPSGVVVDIGSLQGAGFELSGLLYLIAVLNYMASYPQLMQSVEIVDSNDSIEHRRFVRFPLRRLGFADCLEPNVTIDPLLCQELSYDRPSLIDMTKMRIVCLSPPKQLDLFDTRAPDEAAIDFATFVTVSVRAILAANIPAENRQDLTRMSRVLYELVHNVSRHAWHTKGLSRCKWVHDQRQLHAYYSWRVMKQARDVRKSFDSMPYTSFRSDFFCDNSEPFLEGCVIDCGCGVMNSLKAYNTTLPHSDDHQEDELGYLEYAFNKRMDEEMGLYSVLNIISSLGGYIELRSGRSCVSYFGTSDSVFGSATGLPLFPGTLVRFLVPATYRFGKFNAS